MQLSLQNFTTLVQNMAAAVQSAANQLLDLTVGSTLRAILEANASLALWLQWLILQVLQTTRAATSTGADLDTWMADFSLARLPAVPASGIVTFSRFTPLAPALVPVGAAVRTADGSQVFSVVASPASSSYSAEQNGYALGPGIAALDVPVVAQTAGAAGNVQVGAISLLSSALPGVDSVANVAPISERDGRRNRRCLPRTFPKLHCQPLASYSAFDRIRNHQHSAGSGVYNPGECRCRRQCHDGQLCRNRRRRIWCAFSGTSCQHRFCG